jgi:hypothetical protein
MTTSSPGHFPSCTPALNLRAYSFAWSTSWILHGPTMTSSLESGSVPWTMDAAVRRAALIVLLAMAGTGRSCRSRAGGMSGSYWDQNQGGQLGKNVQGS